MKITSGLLLFMLLSGSTALAGQSMRSPNVFVLNGKPVQLSNSLLKKFRQSWDTGVAAGPFATVLGRDDQRWVMDYIAISQALKPKHPCTHLILTKVSPSNTKSLPFEGKPAEAGIFDELWVVNACGNPTTYRVFNPKGTAGLSVYQLKEKRSNRALNLTAPVGATG